MGGVFSFFYAIPHSYWDDFTSQQLPPVLISQALELGYEPGIFASSNLSSPAFYRTDPTPYLNQYKNAVYFNDGLIDKILTSLKQQGLLENTLIILTGDHGQELNDSHQNYWGHNSNFTDYQTKVPFVIYDASRPQPTTYTYRISHHDAAPTILQEVYGCTNPPSDYALGRSLFDSTPARLPHLPGTPKK